MPNLNNPLDSLRVPLSRWLSPGKIISNIKCSQYTIHISACILMLAMGQHVFGQLNISVKTDQYYVVPDQLLGANTIVYPDFMTPDAPCSDCEKSNTGSPCPDEESFQCNKNGGCAGQWRTQFADHLKDNVHSLGFRSLYYPFGSLNRYHHYTPGGYGFCIKSEDANQLAQWASSKGLEDSDPQKQYCNQVSYSYPNFFEQNAELCKNDNDASKSMHLVISANVYSGVWQELKDMLEYCVSHGVIVDAIVFGTEIENDRENEPSTITPDNDTIPFPTANSYFRRVQRVYIDSLKAHSLYQSIPLYFASAIQHENQGGCENRSYLCDDTLGYGSDWNIRLHDAITGYNQTHTSHLRYAGAVNWWWFPLTNSETNPSPAIAIDDMNSFFDIGLSANGIASCYKYPKGNVGGPSTGFDELLVDQWGIKKFQNPCPGTPYQNTFLNQVFILKRVFNMLDNNYNMLYNPAAANGITYTGAFFARLGANNPYNPLDLDSEVVTWDTLNTSNYAFKQLNSISGYKFKKVTITNGPAQNLEGYYLFNCTDQKLIIINYSTTAYKINSLTIDDSSFAKSAFFNYLETSVNDTSSKGALATLPEMTQNKKHTDRKLKNIEMPANSITTITIPFIHQPGIGEACNNIDDDCDGAIDEDIYLTSYLDSDGDGFGDPNMSIQSCPMPNGYVSDHSDCNDDPAVAGWLIHPGSTEICNGMDDNCDGAIDEGMQLTYYFDADGDGYGTSLLTFEGCPHPDNYVTKNTDCNDNPILGGASIYPGAAESCNGLDDNCNTLIDENVQLFFYVDADGDGYGCNVGPPIVRGCSASIGLAPNNTDCNDNPILGGANIHPGQVEICNSIDDNCDGVVDDIIIATILPSGDITVCKNADVTLTAGGSGITYQWLKNNVAIIGATNISYVANKQGDYQVTESNAVGCISTSAITHINMVDKPPALITPLGDLNICATGSVILQANSGMGYTYKWQKGSKKISGETNQTYTATKTGTYKVTVTTSEGCSKTSSGVNVYKSCKDAYGSGEEVTSKLSVYPNPTGDKFSIDLKLPEMVDGGLNDYKTDGAPAIIELMNSLGQVVYSETVFVTEDVLKKEVAFDDSQVPGMYLLKVTVNDLIYSEQVMYQK